LNYFIIVELALATQQQIQGVQQITAASGKPTKVMDIQQQQSQQGKPNTGAQRPLSILPSSLQTVQSANIRAASSVSTQTGVQATVQIQVTILTLAHNNRHDYFECYGSLFAPMTLELLRELHIC